ncbi:acetyl-CoA acetyltransferase [Striga asiatica]|uniref:Acetyl-CoA acetyltransferase n=1 Tax=Striga asiatica TaxID=4170 RepID=A0A5A7PZ32_STRAF|nr:acetyl-CoA acetyltransferase [Striga asiatica]
MNAQLVAVLSLRWVALYSFVALFLSRVHILHEADSQKGGKKITRKKKSPDLEIGRFSDPCSGFFVYLADLSALSDRKREAGLYERTARRNRKVYHGIYLGVLLIGLPHAVSSVESIKGTVDWIAVGYSNAIESFLGLVAAEGSGLIEATAARTEASRKGCYGANGVGGRVDVEVPSAGVQQHRASVSRFQVEMSGLRGVNYYCLYRSEYQNLIATYEAQKVNNPWGLSKSKHGSKELISYEKKNKLSCGRTIRYLSVIGIRGIGTPWKSGVVIGLNSINIGTALLASGRLRSLDVGAPVLARVFMRGIAKQSLDTKSEGVRVSTFEFRRIQLYETGDQDWLVPRVWRIRMNASSLPGFRNPISKQIQVPFYRKQQGKLAGVSYTGIDRRRDEGKEIEMSCL